MSFLDELAGSLPAGVVAVDPNVLVSYRRDEAHWVHGGMPVAAVHPTVTVEVQTAVRIAARHGVPVVARGAGTGLSGGAAAVDGCLVVSTTRMDRIVEVDPTARLAVVEPGVTTARLRSAARDAGLFYPPDPSSLEWSTIGGNVATNAGGFCCLKYGVTADYVLAVEVVLADGRAVRLGRRTRKGVAGYDLVRLVVGSEGTLGIVTEITVRLRPAPAATATVAAFFPSLSGLGNAVLAVSGTSPVPCLLEVMDHPTIAAVEEWRRMDLDVDAAGLLVAQADDPAAPATAERIAEACRAHGARAVFVTEDAAEGEQFLEARRSAYPALERRGATLLDDVCVPVPALPEFVGGVAKVAAAHGLVVAVFGHAGDGNLHPTVVYDRADDDERRRAAQAFDDIVALALHHGGTITGEHGVGRLKVDHLREEVGDDVLDLHRRVKAAFDPTTLLNPGAVLGRTVGRNS